MFCSSSQPTKGPWSVSLHPYIFKKFIEYCPDRQRRWNVYHGKVSRGAKLSDTYYNVQSSVKEIRAFRQDYSQALGYENFAEFSMATKMASSVDQVKAVMDNLLEAG